MMVRDRYVVCLRIDILGDEWGMPDTWDWPTLLDCHPDQVEVLSSFLAVSDVVEDDYPPETPKAGV